MEEKEISQAVISRLPRYFRYLGELKDEGVERVSSKALSDLMNVTASQIRQDLNHFGGFGQQGYGYNVTYLHEEIGKILGLDHSYRLVIVGAGHLGQALANYMNFERRGFLIQALFDINPEITGTQVRGIEVLPMEKLAEYVSKNDIEIGVLTVPKSEAAKIAQTLVGAGIRAIWNFAHVDLDVPDSVQVENVHLSDSLMKLSFNLRKQR